MKPKLSPDIFTQYSVNPSLVKSGCTDIKRTTAGKGKWRRTHGITFKSREGELWVGRITCIDTMRGIYSALESLQRVKENGFSNLVLFIPEQVTGELLTAGQWQELYLYTGVKIIRLAYPTF